jgi:hypothetical protein
VLKIVQNLGCQVDEECGRGGPSLGCVAGDARSGQVVFRWLVAVTTGILWSLLALVGIPRRLVAIGALRFPCQIQLLVAVQALRLGVFPHQL